MRLGKKFLWLVFVPILGAVLLAGCGSTSTSGVTKAPDSKQVLRWGDDIGDIDIATMDPALQTDLYSEQMAEMVFPTLYNLHYDGNTITLVPWVASAPASITGTTMTVTLRSGFKWSDGTPIDAADFAYSINRSLDPCTAQGQGTYGSFFFSWLQGAGTFAAGKCPASQTGKLNPTSPSGLIGKSIVVVDSQTLQFKMAGAFVYAPWSFVTTPGMAVPEQFINQQGLKNWTQHLTDNGGFGGNIFNITSWDHKGHMTLDRNPNSASYPGGAPNLREVQVTFYKDAETAYSAFKDGQEDVTWALPPEDCAAEQGKAEFHSVPFLDIGYIAPAWNVKPFDNKSVRQAFDLALNKQAIAQTVDQCTAFATNHYIPQGNPGYNPNLTGPDGTQSLTGNPSMAKQLFDSYASTACPGGQASNCPAITLTIGTSPTAQKEGAALQAAWQSVLGVTIHIKTQPFNTTIQQIFGPAAGRPQMYTIGYANDFPDPWDWTSLQFGTGPGQGGDNLNAVSDPAATALMVAADTDQNASDRTTKYQQAEQMLVNDVAWISLTQAYVQWLQAPNVQSYNVNPSDYWYPDQMQAAYISQ